MNKKVSLYSSNVHKHWYTIWEKYRYPPAQDSWSTYGLVKQYVTFVREVADHTCFVSAGEKTLLE